MLKLIVDTNIFEKIQFYFIWFCIQYQHNWPQNSTWNEKKCSVLDVGGKPKIGKTQAIRVKTENPIRILSEVGFELGSTEVKCWERNHLAVLLLWCPLQHKLNISSAKFEYKFLVARSGPWCQRKIAFPLQERNSRPDCHSTSTSVSISKQPSTSITMHH